jgi:hypothetical protein
VGESCITRGDKNTYDVLVRWPEGKISFESLSIVMEGDIEINLKKMGLEGLDWLRTNDGLLCTCNGPSRSVKGGDFLTN